MVKNIFEFDQNERYGDFIDATGNAAQIQLTTAGALPVDLTLTDPHIDIGDIHLLDTATVPNKINPATRESIEGILVALDNAVTPTRAPLLVDETTGNLQTDAIVTGTVNIGTMPDVNVATLPAIEIGTAPTLIVNNATAGDLNATITGTVDVATLPAIEIGTAPTLVVSNATAASLHTLAMPNRVVNVTSATGSAAINTTTAIAKKFRLSSITLHADAVMADAENLTISVNANDGAGYDTVLYSIATDGVTDICFTPTNDLIFEAGDEIVVACANTNTVTYGLRIVCEEI